MDIKKEDPTLKNERFKMINSDKTIIKDYNKSAGALSSEIAHTVVDLKSVELKKEFISAQMKSEFSSELILVSDDGNKLSSLTKKTKKTSVAYSCTGDELIGAVRAIECLIVTRSFIFNQTESNNFVEHNSKAKNSLPLVVCAFDLEGSKLWDGDNKDAFLRITKIIEVAAEYGIKLVFFNVAQSIERLNLEFYSAAPKACV